MAKITRFKEYSFTESMVDDFIKTFVNENSNDPQIEEILKRFKQKFGNKKPKNQEFADFYHELRSDGIDGILIFTGIPKSTLLRRIFSSIETNLISFFIFCPLFTKKANIEENKIRKIIETVAITFK